MLIIAACGSDDAVDDAAPEAATPDAAPETSPDAEPAERTRVVVALTEDVNKLDPMDGAGSHEWRVMYELADTLFDRNPDGSASPALANSMTQSADGMSWIIELRDDVYFHNGDHMTSADLVWTIERAPTLPSSVGTYWSAVESVQALDDYTVEVTMSEPDALLAHNATRTAVLPAEYFESVGVDEYSRAPVAAGAFKFVEWIPDERIVLEAFDDYWRGRPEIDEVIFRVIPQEASQVAALLAGEIDITVAISPESVEQIRATGTADVRATPSLDRLRVMIDTNVPPLDIVEVRQAINYAMDVDLICEELLSGFCAPIPTGLHPAEAGYLDIEPYGYNPDRARELLAEAGFPDGIPEPINLSINLREMGAEDVGAAIGEMLNAVGIPTTLEMQNPQDFREAVTPPKTNGPLLFQSHSAGGGFHVVNNMMQIFHCDGNERHSGYYCNPEVDRRSEEAQQIWATDQERAIQLYQEAQQIMFDDAAAGFLYYEVHHHGVASNLVWEPNPAALYNFRVSYWQ